MPAILANGTIMHTLSIYLSIYLKASVLGIFGVKVTSMQYMLCHCRVAYGSEWLTLW